MEEEKEEWRDVSINSDYSISSFGRVKSKKHGKDKLLSLVYNVDKYPKVTLYKFNTKHTINVHVLVASAFLSHIPDRYSIVVDHINGNKSDNRLKNIRLVTNRENVSVCYRAGSSGFSSKYACVSWCKRNGKWHSKITIDKKRVHVGYFDVEIDAATAYQNRLALIPKQSTTIHKKCINAW